MFLALAGGRSLAQAADFSAGRFEQSHHQADEGGFAGPVGAQQTEADSGGNLQRNMVDHFEMAVVEG